MMKKFLSMLMVATLTASMLVGCSKTKEAETVSATTKETVKETVAETTTEATTETTTEAVTSSVETTAEVVAPTEPVLTMNDIITSLVTEFANQGLFESCEAQGIKLAMSALDNYITYEYHVFNGVPSDADQMLNSLVSGAYDNMCTLYQECSECPELNGVQFVYYNTSDEVYAVFRVNADETYEFNYYEENAVSDSDNSSVEDIAPDTAYFKMGNDTIYVYSTEARQMFETGSDQYALGYYGSRFITYGDSGITVGDTDGVLNRFDYAMCVDTFTLNGSVIYVGFYAAGIEILEDIGEPNYVIISLSDDYIMYQLESGYMSIEELINIIRDLSLTLN